MRNYQNRYNDAGFADYLHDLLRGNELHGVAIGLTIQVIDAGIRSLSPHQKLVFEQHVMEPYYVPACKQCQHAISWSDMYQALDDRSCSACARLPDQAPAI